MQKQLKNKKPRLRISHQSEVLRLRQTIAALQKELMDTKQQLNRDPVSPIVRKIKLPSKGHQHFISLDDICYCEAEGNYTKVWVQIKEVKNHKTSYTSLFVSKSLKSITNLISSSDFIRCHQSFLVNKKHVTGFNQINGLYLKIANEKIVPVSRRNRKMVLEAL